MRLRDQLPRYGTFPSAKVEVVPEYGFKARVVTKSQGALVHTTQNLRKRILALLKLIPSTSVVLKGNKEQSIKRLFPCGTPEGKDPIVVSADLSKASDRIPFWVTNAIWNQIAISLDLTEDEQDLVQLATGPQVLEYPDGSTLTSR